MLFNLIDTLTRPVPYGFPATDDNTVTVGMIHKTGSKITREFDKVVFVELKKDPSLFIEINKKKDLVIAIGPWRQLAFVDNNAGSGVGEVLETMEHFQRENVTIVAASGDSVFKDLIGTVEDEEEEAKKQKEPTADSSSGSEKLTRQPQRRPKSKPEPTTDDYFGSEKPVKWPKRRPKIDHQSREEIPQPRRKSAAFVDLSGVDDEEDDD